jgi:hypothetical protein
MENKNINNHFQGIIFYQDLFPLPCPWPL